MTLHAYRSQRVEELVAALAHVLETTSPDDPFEAIPIIVGSRGMERWLRHELATRLGSLARVDFLFPRTAFEGAAHWLLAGPVAGDRTAFWDLAPAASDAWGGAPLSMRVLSCMRARLKDPSFSRIRRYLGEVGEDVGAREMSFADEVSGTIERLLYDRPDEALVWANAPTSAPEEHVWLAALLADLQRDIQAPSPARTLADLRSVAPLSTQRSLFVFGLSTLRPGDKERLAVLARHLELHVFALAPSSEWWEDIRKTSAQHAALRDAESPERIADLLQELERQNALLAANGEPSRDLQLWFETLGYDEPIDARPLEPAASLLGRVHEWVDRAADNPRKDAAGDAPWREWAPTPSPTAPSSLEVHACHGPLRQCEALRDELLRRFVADPSIEPRHVLVMTPDIATYAPLLAAVFARHSEGTPSIPLHIADLGIRATNPLAEALLQLLALADERVTASRLLEVLAIRPVRARFELTDDDLADLRTMIVDSGIRWGWDATDRSNHKQPKLGQNTIHFGLERLALGVLMHDPGGLGVVPATSGDAPAAVPIEIATRDRVERFGRLAELCAKLEGVRGRVLDAATLPAWRKRLFDLLDDFTLVDDGALWLRVQVDETLGELLPDFTEGAGRDLKFDRSALVARVRGSFELPQHGDRPITGAVTVCALEPMRSVPFRVIAMLGLDDNKFPRPGRTPAWDPFAASRRGEHDRRTVDRHLFFEALLCAREAFLLFGNGFEPKRGAHVPLSVAVSELTEVVAAGVGCAADNLLIRHPLQPWSERSFADEGRLPFDALWIDAAEALRGKRTVAGLAATSLEANWPPEELPPRTVTAEALASALAKPQEELLRKRLGLALAPEDTTVPDREPLEHDTLGEWALRDLVLRASADGSEPDVDALETRLRGEGVLALKAGGRHALETCVSQVGEARRRAAAVPGAPAEKLQSSCEIDGVLVTATATDVRADAANRNFVWVTASKKPNARLQLLAWITLLVTVASGTEVQAAHLAACGAALELQAPTDSDAARAQLLALVKTWKRARSCPLPLFPSLSRDLAKRQQDDPSADPASLVRTSSSVWEGIPNLPGDREDPWVSALFGHLSVDDLAEQADTLLETAALVWRPLLDALVAKTRKASPAGSKGGKAAKATKGGKAAASATGATSGEDA